MTSAAGADGCPSGWLSIRQDLETGELRSERFDTARGLILQPDPPAVLTIDIPIGLTERGQRRCDTEARQALGRPRGSSVFPPPVRGVLPSFGVNVGRPEVSELHRQIDGRGIGVQTWGIIAKIKEVDDILTAKPGLQERVREVHPEVSFGAWAGHPMRFRKKNRQGREERRNLVDDFFGREAVETIRAEYLVREVGHDDILDAFAALWTARRILERRHQTLPEAPPYDCQGLRMEIAY